MNNMAGSHAQDGHTLLAERIEAPLLKRIAELEAEISSESQQYEDLRTTYVLETEQLRARIAELENDAARYRVLRDSEYQLHEDDPSVSDSFFNQYFGEELDEAVDALKARFDAMKEQA